jgi:hypothetical protein
LKQIIYLSRPIVPVTSELIESISMRARLRNPALEITGLLLYGSGRFMQLVEGPEPRVRTLLEKVGNDPRHTEIEILLDRNIETRFYPDWYMGVYNIDANDGRVDDQAIRDRLRALNGTETRIRRNIVLAFEILRRPDPDEFRVVPRVA